MTDEELIWKAAQKNYNKSNVAEDEETKGFEQIKPTMTEEEAKEWFIDSDDFHQAFHAFMAKNKYSEKEMENKQFWTKQNTENQISNQENLEEHI